jgi:hypothetical protein
MAAEELIEDLTKQSDPVEGTQKIEKALSPEEIWQRLDSESKMIACLIAIYGISLTVPFLTKEAGLYLRQKYEKSARAKNEDLDKLIEKIVENDLVKLIGTGVVNWTTPQKNDQELVERGKGGLHSSKKPVQSENSSYSRESRQLEFQVAKKSLENREPNERGYNERFIFINREFKQLALAHSKNIKPV